MSKTNTSPDASVSVWWEQRFFDALRFRGARYTDDSNSAAIPRGRVAYRQPTEYFIIHSSVDKGSDFQIFVSCIS
jgi:hypothetical protein